MTAPTSASSGNQSHASLVSKYFFFSFGSHGPWGRCLPGLMSMRGVSQMTGAMLRRRQLRTGGSAHLQRPHLPLMVRASERARIAAQCELLTHVDARPELLSEACS